MTTITPTSLPPVPEQALGAPQLTRDRGALLPLAETPRHGQPAMSSLERAFCRFLARKLARRYNVGHEPFDDLLQVASFGLVKAVDRFDCSRGNAFSSFAVPTILGELKRYFRDHGWAVHVPRGAQERAVKVEEAQQQLSARSGRAPTVSHLAEYLELSIEEVLDGARDSPRPSRRHRSTRSTTTARAIARSWSIPLARRIRSWRLPMPGSRCGVAAAQLTSRRERQVIVALRFVHDLTQTQIAEQIGVSQMAGLEDHEAVDRTS